MLVRLKMLPNNLRVACRHATQNRRKAAGKHKKAGWRGPPGFLNRVKTSTLYSEPTAFKSANACSRRAAMLTCAARPQTRGS